MGFVSDTVCQETLELYRSCDYERNFVHKDPVTRLATPWPVGSKVFFELCTSPSVTVWQATISGVNATFKVPAVECDKVVGRTSYRLKWLRPGEVAGGVLIRFGRVSVRAACS